MQERNDVIYHLCITLKSSDIIVDTNRARLTPNQLMPNASLIARRAWKVIFLNLSYMNKIGRYKIHCTI